MKNKNFTHTGVLVAANSCVPADYRHPVKLRETKRFYITQHNIKYRKDGFGVGDYPVYQLTEITPIVPS